MVLSGRLSETARNRQTIASIAGLRWSLIGWLAVGDFGLTVTRAFAPIRALAIIVTSSLVSAYAGQPASTTSRSRPGISGRHRIYAAALPGTIGILTLLGLAVIRIWSFTLPRPDPDPDDV